MSTFNPQAMTYAGLARFAAAVDAVMEADDITALQRRDLITYWAYQYARADMPQQLAAAIARCRGDADELRSGPTTCISAVSGEEVAYNPGV